MILDDKLVFSDGQAITATASSTNVINWVQAEPNLGAGTPVKVKILIGEDFNNLTDLTIDLQHAADDTPDLVLKSLPSILLADLVKGAEFELFIPPEHLQYMDLNYTVNGSNPSTGKITAFLSLDR
jgi:hypothetical protein